MNSLRFALVTDGTSDSALEYPLRWLLRKNGVRCSIDGGWFDPRELPRKPRGLAEQISAAVDLKGPCDLLFVHRDGEKDPQPLEKRRQEISNALAILRKGLVRPRHVCVIPVRMTEAWFLHDERAIRMAVENPHGRGELNLPTSRQIESLDAKETLNELMLVATDKTNRRLRGFSTGEAFHRLASLVEDFAPLRQLTAFQAVETELREVVRAAGWDH